MENMDRFTSLIKEMTEFFDAFQLIEKEKLQAAASNDILRLEELMKKEQAEILVLRGFERKQQEIQADMGCEGLTFKEIIEKAPESGRAELENVYSRLSDSLDLFQKTTQSVKQAIDINLHEIQKVLQKVKKKETKPTKGTRSFTSRKV
ncbi:flagellar export chaperone FlgN [Proteocatella sphenisci]|uniref:flagellar export chaperone FlgN n=1 Tax=Proteocatella sphenisci TaxID=181070 RepID=UPI00048EFB48|nr:flagellar export chaperone FlgN [Proteocatella sphenisci]